MNSKKRILIILLFLPVLASAQVFTGGNIGVSFSESDGYYVDAAPLAGYQIKNFKAGVAAVGSYTGFFDSRSKYSFGGRVFTEYTIIKGIFLHAEFEVLNTEVLAYNPDGSTTKKRLWNMAAPMGVGYEYPITKNIKAQGMVLWDVLHNSDSPGQNPIIRGGLIYSL
jgi:hypothetical protein